MAWQNTWPQGFQPNSQGYQSNRQGLHQPGHQGYHQLDHQRLNYQLEGYQQAFMPQQNASYLNPAQAFQANNTYLAQPNPNLYHHLPFPQSYASQPLPSQTVPQPFSASAGYQGPTGLQHQHVPAGYQAPTRRQIQYSPASRGHQLEGPADNQIQHALAGSQAQYAPVAQTPSHQYQSDNFRHSAQLPPPILGQLDPPLGRAKYHPDPVKDAAGLPIIHPGSQLPVRHFPGIPNAFRAEPEMWQLETWFRQYPGLSYNDFVSRLPANTKKWSKQQRNALNNRRMREARRRYNSRDWSGRHFGTPSRTIIEFVSALTPDQVRLNTSWVVTPNGIHPPGLPHAILPLDFYIREEDGHDHMPSKEIADAIALRDQLNNKAWANGNADWTKLAKADLPKEWFIRVKEKKEHDEGDKPSPGQKRKRGEDAADDDVEDVEGMGDFPGSPNDQGQSAQSPAKSNKRAKQNPPTPQPRRRRTARGLWPQPLVEQQPISQQLAFQQPAYQHPMAAPQPQYAFNTQMAGNASANFQAAMQRAFALESSYGNQNVTASMDPSRQSMGHSNFGNISGLDNHEDKSLPNFFEDCETAFPTDWDEIMGEVSQGQQNSVPNYEPTMPAGSGQQLPVHQNPLIQTAITDAIELAGENEQKPQQLQQQPGNQDDHGLVQNQQPENEQERGLTNKDLNDAFAELDAENNKDSQAVEDTIVLEPTNQASQFGTTQPNEPPADQVEQNTNDNLNDADSIDNDSLFGGDDEAQAPSPALTYTDTAPTLATAITTPATVTAGPTTPASEEERMIADANADKTWHDQQQAAAHYNPAQYDDLPGDFFDLEFNLDTSGNIGIDKSRGSTYGQFL